MSFNIEKIKPYMKSVAAVLAALTTTISLVADGEVSSDDMIAIIAAWGGVVGVYQLRNKPLKEK